MAKRIKSTEEDIQVISGQEEIPVSPRIESKARKLMSDRNIDTIWYCPGCGHWFTKPDRAQEYARSNNITLKKFEK
ncbi:hypothetical protein FACS1894177_07820 [Bacteroidia bacterium]|nr:hypothetical protein FACS1894177_07820 [Bacteroidia bacterium]